MRGFRGLPFGHPPLRAFLRAAAVLALDLALPPRRPRATAAGFLVGVMVILDLPGPHAAIGTTLAGALAASVDQATSFESPGSQS